MAMNQLQNFTKGFFKENPVLVLLLGMCPTLGTTSSAINGLGMGLATTFVLLASNVAISAVKNLIPDKVRIPAFIVIIASFVTIVDLVMQAYFNDLGPNGEDSLYDSLGLFIPLIVVNCIVLGRAEAFASKNTIVSSMIDGLGMGLGFTMGLVMLGSIREILGSGSIFNLRFVADDASTILLFIMPPGAFIALGYLIAVINRFKKKTV